MTFSAILPSSTKKVEIIKKVTNRENLNVTEIVVLTQYDLIQSPKLTSITQRVNMSHVGATEISGHLIRLTADFT